MITVPTELSRLLRVHSTPKFAEIMAWSFVLTPPYLHDVLIRQGCTAEDKGFDIREVYRQTG